MKGYDPRRANFSSSQNNAPSHNDLAIVRIVDRYAFDHFLGRISRIR